jgi:hypothetical protein
MTTSELLTKYLYYQGGKSHLVVKSAPKNADYPAHLTEENFKRLATSSPENFSVYNGSLIHDRQSYYVETLGREELKATEDVEKRLYTKEELLTMYDNLIPLYRVGLPNTAYLKLLGKNKDLPFDNLSLTLDSSKNVQANGLDELKWAIVTSSLGDNNNGKYLKPEEWAVYTNPIMTNRVLDPSSPPEASAKRLKETLTAYDAASQGSLSTLDRVDKLLNSKEPASEVKGRVAELTLKEHYMRGVPVHHHQHSPNFVMVHYKDVHFGVMCKITGYDVLVQDQVSALRSMLESTPYHFVTRRDLLDKEDFRQAIRDAYEAHQKSTPSLCPPDKALRYNTGKPKWSLVDFESLLPMIEVLEYGAEKYAPHNWKKGLPVSEIVDSLLRHTTSFMAGEDLDPESKKLHVGHMMCNLMFLVYTLQHHPDFDDRHRP